MGLVRLIIASMIGAFFLRILPRSGVLASTQEIIAFLSLLMAGLLPAMILTATILRGSSLTPSAVGEYGASLKTQLLFWASMFIAAGFSTLGIIGAKIFYTPGSSFALTFGTHVLDSELASGLSLWVAGAGLGVVIQRLKAAFSGLLSLLDLNVSMSVAEAAKRQQDLLEAFDREAALAVASSEAPYNVH